MGGPRFTPVVALQGEIGASPMKCRDMKNKLKMVNHLKNTENSLLKAVAERMVETRNGGWIKQVEEYMNAIGTSYAELTKMKEEKIKLKVNEREERRWRTEVEEKETEDRRRKEENVGGTFTLK